MKAVVVKRFGGPDVLSYEDVEMPKAGRGEVLIKVLATSVNFADIKARVGEYHGVKSSTFIPGLDCAGVIEQVGEGVTSLKVGQRVIAFPKNGSYAEYVVANERLTYPIPDELSTEVAAASLTVGVTAYNVLKKMARLSEGESVLIHAAAGGVGTTAVQLAKKFGASKIIGTVGSDEKKELVLKLGADEVINYREADFVEEVNRITEGKGVDVILDTISGETFERGFDCLTYYGRIVIFGHANDGSKPGIIKTDLLHASCRSVIGYSTGTSRKMRPEFLKEAAEAVISLLTRGELTMHISKKFPLKDAGEAQAFIESRKSQGKVLLIP